MNKRWFYALCAVIVIVALAIGYTRFRPTPPNPSASVHWKTRNPVLSPSSQPLPTGSSAAGLVRSLSYPKSQLPNAEWYWPISNSSSISFILHDGRARWVVDGHTYTLKSPPDNPNEEFASAPGGQEIAWQEPTGGVTVLNANGHATHVANADAAAFTPSGSLVMLSTDNRVSVGSQTLPWTAAGTPAALHPFVGQASGLVVDQQGVLEKIQIPSGRIVRLAQVRTNRWPHLVTARSVGTATVLLMERPSPIPRYLILWVKGRQVRWYRFAAPTTPELGVLHQAIIVENLEPSGTLALVTSHRLEPLNVSAAIFSQSASGIVWQNGQGFSALYGWH